MFLQALLEFTKKWGNVYDPPGVDESEEYRKENTCRLRRKETRQMDEEIQQNHLQKLILN